MARIRDKYFTCHPCVCSVVIECEKTYGIIWDAILDNYLKMHVHTSWFSKIKNFLRVTVHPRTHDQGWGGRAKGRRVISAKKGWGLLPGCYGDGRPCLRRPVWYINKKPGTHWGKGKCCCMKLTDGDSNRRSSKVRFVCECWKCDTVLTCHTSFN